mgnify:CR=1 FL=1
MDDLTLHGLPPSSYVRTAMMICEAKEVSYTLEPVDFRSQDYKDTHHPFGRMPALTHGAVRRYETLAIAVYVDEAFDGPSLQPTDVVGKAQMFQWISVINDYLYERVVGACVSERFVKPMRGLEPDIERITASLPGIAEGMAAVNRALDAHPSLAGAQMSLADLILAPVLHYFRAGWRGVAACLWGGCCLDGADVNAGGIRADQRAWRVIGVCLGGAGLRPDPSRTTLLDDNVLQSECCSSLAVHVARLSSLSNLRYEFVGLDFWNELTTQPELSQCTVANATLDSLTKNSFLTVS